MHAVSNRPEPVLWTKDGAELPDPDRMVVSGRELNILFLNKTDNGTYRCEATNTIGQSSAEYVLIVHGEFFWETVHMNGGKPWRMDKICQHC